jgi:hypothetical protein
VSISIVKDQIVKFVRVRQVFFALAIICPIIFSYKSLFCPTKCDLSGNGGTNFLDP